MLRADVEVEADQRIGWNQSTVPSTEGTAQPSPSFRKFGFFENKPTMESIVQIGQLSVGRNHYDGLTGSLHRSIVNTGNDVRFDPLPASYHRITGFAAF